MIKISGVEKELLKLSNGVQINVPCDGRLWSYLELIEKIILVVNIYDLKYCNQYRNIFCYAKSDGRQLWQIEQAYDHRTHEPLEEVYKYIKIHILQTDGSYEDASEAFECADGVIGERYLKPFRSGKDRLSTMTLSQFPNEYWIDYETGKVEWFAIHQKI